MKSKNIIVPILVSIVPLGFIILNTLDLYDVFGGKYDYPFGSEFYTKYSTYSSKTVYVIYHSVFILILCTVIYFAFKKKWNLFFISLAIGVLMTLYPLYFNT